jgi:translation initiation factor 3 subunit L
LVEVPDVVADFLRYFRDVLVNKQDVGVIHNIYEQTWNKLTDRFFRNSSWPPVQSVAPLVDEGMQDGPKWQ